VDVFLIRHAEAIDETLELRDPMRHLTAAGRTQATSLGDRLRWHDCTPTHIWTSPLVRAVQTAELVATGLASTIAVEVIPALAPGENPRTVVAAIETIGELVLAERGRYMVDTNQGLTKTYNTLKDPSCDEPRIVTLRHRRDVSITFALSTDVSFFRRVRASEAAMRTTRSISAVV